MYKLANIYNFADASINLQAASFVNYLMHNTGADIENTI